MNEETIIGGAAAEETEETAENTAPDISEIMAEMEKIREENVFLKRKIFCAENNIPSEIAQDIICIAEADSKSKNIGFEEAAKAAYARITRLSAGRNTSVTTGTAIKNSTAYGGDPLRSAFGLK